MNFYFIMSPELLLIAIISYFLLLITVTYFTGKDDSNETFFNANRNSKWYVVAYGMIGASLSGVTFVSVPGWVGTTQFSYLQVVLGYFLGYLIIGFVLIPLYYKLKINSIYEYLLLRFGKSTQKTGSFFFLISRLLIASFRLYLVVSVLQYFVLNDYGVPFELTVVLSVLFIWIYTVRGGIKTIVWTDLLQTTFMLGAVVFTVYHLLEQQSSELVSWLRSSDFQERAQIWFIDDFNDRKHLIKSLLGGMLIAVAMTGLDQDNMQKNLTCKNSNQARANVISLGAVLIPVNLLFLILGGLLFSFAANNGIEIPVVNGQEKTDLLYPQIALNSDLGVGLGLVFILGLLAAAFSSADSALTSLTTSFCVDFLPQSKSQSIGQRKLVHVLFSVLIVLLVILYNYAIEDAIIATLLQVASYTYGPLLGLFTFGLFTKYQLQEKWVAPIAATAIGLTFILNHFSMQWFNGYQFGYELLGLNGLFMIIGLFIIRDSNTTTKKSYF